MSMIEIAVMAIMLIAGVAISIFVTYKRDDLRERGSVVMLERLRGLMDEHGAVIRDKYPELYAQANVIIDNMVSYLNSDTVSVKDRVAYIYQNVKFFMNLATLIGVQIDKKDRGSGESIEDIVSELE